jgi:large subunit ribosomal protein L4
LSLHASRESLAVFDASVFDAPSTKQAASLLGEWGAPTPTLVILADEEAAAALSFRNLAHASVLPVDDAGVADLVGAASLLISEAALPALVARAGQGATPERQRATHEGQGATRERQRATREGQGATREDRS